MRGLVERDEIWSERTVKGSSDESRFYLHTSWNVKRQSGNCKKKIKGRRCQFSTSSKQIYVESTADWLSGNTAMEKSHPAASDCSSHFILQWRCSNVHEVNQILSNPFFKCFISNPSPRNGVDHKMIKVIYRKSFCSPFRGTCAKYIKLYNSSLLKK